MCYKPRSMVMRSKIGSENASLYPDYNLRPKGSSPAFAEDVDTANNLLRMVRLRHQPIVTKVAGLIGSPPDSRGQNHVNVRMIFANLSSKLETVNTAG